jgi:uncharacterized protein (TIGR02147 family)
MANEVVLILNEKFKERVHANPSYSLRSFARDLKVSPSTLSEIFNERKGISKKLALQLAERLHLPEWEQVYFKELVQVECSKNLKGKKQAQTNFEAFKRQNSFQLIQNKALKALTSWVELAILELTYIPEFQPNAKWIAKQLAVSPLTIEQAINRLVEGQLLEIDSKTGKWTDVSPLFTTTDGVPSETIRNFHRTVLNLALKKLDNTDVKSRTVKTIVLSVSEKNKENVKKILDEAINKIAALGDQKSPDCNDVICFSGQIFSLLNKGNLE